MTDEQREAFERWISSPPYELSTKQWSDDPCVAMWPGHYTNYRVQIASEAFLAGIEFQKKESAK